MIIFEAGATHNGVESAIELARAAKRAGADAIKYQIFAPDELCQDKEQLFEYQYWDVSGPKTIKEPLYEILRRRHLSHSEWEDVISTAFQLDLEVIATAGNEKDCDFILSQGIDIKISSADIDHYPLLRKVKDGWVHIDTGSASLEEIQQAVDILGSCVIHHCPTGYPATNENVNLRMINVLKAAFPRCEIAFSDHSPGWEMCKLAAAMGAEHVEKTITLDKTQRSPEHIMSLEPDEATRFVEDMKNLEVILGGVKPINDNNDVRRSPYAIGTIQAGELVHEGNVEFKRPGRGLKCDLLHSR